MISLLVWFIVASLLCLISHKFAILRGQRTGHCNGDGREPMPLFLDKIFRLSFLTLFWIYPLCNLISNWLLIPWIFYIPSYLDESEKMGGRPSDFYRNIPFWSWFKSRLNLKLVVVERLDPSKQVCARVLFDARIFMTPRAHQTVHIGCPSAWNTSDGRNAEPHYQHQRRSQSSWNRVQLRCCKVLAHLTVG